ncbi:hypothetical protein OIV83_004332 [Microbotryomycetes sp. JL201]|nr:hypothetical protein OIV83_004293 [Microbotryomycetes sp. JL201]KAK4049184.1 hypothetical protein OIV83_004332 [Microbotryomycetes sp. JL201]
MSANLNNQGTTPVPPNKALLQLVSGSAPRRLTLPLLLHFLYVFLPNLLFVLPARLVWHHLINRWRSNVAKIGRPVYSDFVVKLSQFILSRCTAAEARILFNRTVAYDITFKGPQFAGYRDWVTPVDVKGVQGRWIAPPGTKRKDDEVVLYFIHGGGFVLDTAGNAQVYFLQLAKELNKRRKLAPEFKYPSQLIEVQAGYHYLVNTLGIEPEKICVAGDSAGGNLCLTFLMHLARPNPKIIVPEALGPVPKRPGSAFLISPMVNLASAHPSRRSGNEFDYIEDGGAYRVGLDYIGQPPLRENVPSFNPIYFFKMPHPAPPPSILAAKKPWNGTEGEGLDLLWSPYVNPSANEDLSWWKEALPGNGRTLVSWGGKEVFADDIEHFIAESEKAGVSPQRLVKPLGAHDWVLYDSFIPGVWDTYTKGPDREKSYNVQAVASFLQEIDIERHKARFTSVPKTGSNDLAPQREGKREPEQAEVEREKKLAAKVEPKQDKSSATPKQKPVGQGKKA